MPDYSLLPSRYTTEFKSGEHFGSELVLNVSSSNKPSFYRTDFCRPTLYVGDGTNSYYTRQIDIVAYALARFLDKHGFTKVVLTGPSKAGFGALRISTLCAAHTPHVQFSNLVFSPQVRLYPIDPNLSFPSYQWLIRKAESDTDYARDLAAFGSLPDHWPSNVAIRAFCGKENEQDAAQTALLPSIANITYLPFGGHLSHLPFVIDVRNAQAVRLVVGKAMNQASAVGDEMSPEAQEVFIQELLAMGTEAQQTIVDLANIEFAEMRRRSAGHSVSVPINI